MLEEWRWTSRYPTQPEILRYADHVADRFDLRQHIEFSTRVTSARYDDAAQQWHVETDAGDKVRARFCIMATGCLSAARTPPFPGLETFEGASYHTAHWPHEPVDFAGQRVGVIGTGSSGIQSIPEIAKAADHVYVFQRTPNFSLPANDRPLDDEILGRVGDDYSAYKETARMSRDGVPLPVPKSRALDLDDETRRSEYEARWERGGPAFLSTFTDLLRSERANQTAADFVRAKIRAVVRDPNVAELLEPKDHPVGSKRICIDSDYYATYNRANVTLVDVRTAPIVEITPTGLRTAAETYDLDAIVYATGFDAMTGALMSIDIRGSGGRELRQKWDSGPRTYLGLMTAGFPNLFMVTGPGSPSVLSNMIISIEQHVEWIADCLAHMRDHGLTAIDAVPEAEEAWVEHVNDLAARTLYLQANSWYLGANIPGKPRVFMPYVGGVGAYREICDGVVAKGYEGFRLSPSDAAAVAGDDVALEEVVRDIRASTQRVSEAPPVVAP
jgi:cyclohexanone monooxygenase